MTMAAGTAPAPSSSGRYLDVIFQKNPGTLVINAEKVVFRPKADANASSRSWRWAVIDRVEVMDPSRGSPYRSLKLKSSTNEKKVVTLSVPGGILEDVLNDINHRLNEHHDNKSPAAKESSVVIEGPIKTGSITTNNSNNSNNNDTLPTGSMRRKSTMTNAEFRARRNTGQGGGRRGSLGTTTTASMTTATGRGAATESSPRRAKSTTVTVHNTRRGTAELVSSPRRSISSNTGPGGTQRKKKDHLVGVMNRTSPPTTRRSTGTNPATSAATNRNTAGANRRSTVPNNNNSKLNMPSLAHTLNNNNNKKSNSNTNKSISAASVGSSSNRSQGGNSHHSGGDNNNVQVTLPWVDGEPTFEANFDNIPPNENPAAAVVTPEATNQSNTSSKGAGQLSKLSQKLKPNLKSLKQQQEKNRELKKKELEAKRLLLSDMADTSSGVTPIHHTPVTTAQKKGGVGGLLSGFMKSPPLSAPAASGRRLSSLDSEILQIQQKQREQAARRRSLIEKSTERRASIRAKKDRLTSPRQQRVRASSLAAFQPTVFVPGTTSSVTTEEDPSTNDIMFKPGNNINKKKNNKKDVNEEDVTSRTSADNSTSSEDDGDGFGGPKDTFDAEPNKMKNHHHGNAALWNPNAPEHKFRMMILHHSATCQVAKGSCCPYDPICSEFKTVLQHIEGCQDPECDFPKCRDTRNFLVTMRLMTTADDEQKTSNKDFLIGMGAMAPIPVINIGEDCCQGSRVGEWDAFSMVSDSTWWEKAGA